MSNSFLGRFARKRNDGRSMRIDRWDKLELVIELITSSLPIDVRMELNHAENLTPLATPLPYDLRTGSSTTIPTLLPLLAEVRVSLCVDDTFAWLLPVYFCIDQMLTAGDVVTKLAEAYRFLNAWSQVHTHEGREHLRIGRLQAQCPSKFRREYLIQ